MVMGSNRRGSARQGQQRLLGRSRRARAAFIAGNCIAVGGVGALMTFVYIEHQSLNWVRLLGSLALVAIIVGVVVAGIALLAIRGRSIEEAYQLGYDLGFERGYAAGTDTESLADVIEDPR